MSSTWMPEPQGLQEILHLLRESTNSSNNEFHRQVNEKLNQLNQHAEFNNYLIYILTQMTSEDERIRAMAGLVLKNNVRSSYPKFYPHVKQYIKENCLASIGDPLMLVRSTIGNIITTIVTRGKLQDWPELLPSLIARLDSPQYQVLEGAFCALHRVCEDSTRDSQSGNNDIFGQPLNVMLPIFLRFFDSSYERIRMYAVSCVTQFYMSRPNTPVLVQYLNQFIQGLYNHAMDTSSEVRRTVCQALVMLLEAHPDHLMSQMQKIVEYMLMSTQDEDDGVALEACEFWLAVAELEESKQILLPFLPRLIPVLLKRMVYSELDLQSMSGTRDDYDVPDRPEDMKPRFHYARSHHAQSTEDTSTRTGISARGLIDDDLGEEDEDDYDDDEEDDELYSEWNIRKCSAAALDILATVFQDHMLPFLLPLLREMLTSADWSQRECGILALGAVAEGCLSGISPHLVQLIPFLLQNLRDSKPLVRSITCWSLSRYSHWCVDKSRKDEFLQPLIHELLERVLDNNKRVQEAACSAFATLEEEAQQELVPYMEYILQNLMNAFKKYKNINLVILYDAIGTLAEAVGRHLNSEAYIAILMPPLIEKWNALTDDNMELFPLLEALSSIATAMGPGFARFAPPVFERCIRLISNTLAQLEEYEISTRHATPETMERKEKPDRDFLIVALDLLSSLAEGLGASIESLVVRSNPPLLNLLHKCMVDITPDIRQSAFALVGDLSASCFLYIKPVVNEFIPILIKNLEPRHVSVCNNASWALGEIALQFGDEMRPWIGTIFTPLQMILCHAPEQQIPRTLQENVAITVGRLGCVAPDVLAPQLSNIFLPWCRTMRHIRDNPEKESAFLGICRMIELNPQGIVNDFIYFCDAVASWHSPHQMLHSRFMQILHAFKNMIGPNWRQYYSTFPEPVRNKLQLQYNLLP